MGASALVSRWVGDTKLAFAANLTMPSMLSPLQVFTLL
jgi:hypothetical protein